MASFSNPVLIVDVASKQITDANDAAVALTGYAKDELLRKTLDDIYTPETVAAILEYCVRRHILDAMPGLLSKVGDGSLLTKTGTREHVELYCQVFQVPTLTVLVENRPLHKRL